MKRITRNCLFILPLAIVVALVSIAVYFGLQSSVPYEEETIDGKYNVVYNEGKNEAFIGEIVWDGKDDSSGRTFTIPDETSGGMKISSLGGFKGKGNERPFYVSVPEEGYVTYSVKDGETWDGNWRYVEEEEFLENNYSDAGAKNLYFYINVGEYISKIGSTRGRRYIGLTVKNDDGTENFIIRYKICYHFEVVDTNVTFTGKSWLYYKETSTQITDFFY